MSLRVVDATGLVTIQDRGRVGYAHLGVPRAGALDRQSAALGNRLVGNDVDAAVLEITFGTLTAASATGTWVAVTGAPCQVWVNGVIRTHHRAEWVPSGARLAVGAPEQGMRVYLAVAGGIDVDPVLGSRSTDTLAWVGPPQVEVDQVLPTGRPMGPPVEHETPRPPRPGPLRVRPGPRTDWFEPEAFGTLLGSSYAVGPQSNRIGVRLEGPTLDRRRHDELPSEPVVIGAIQVPPSGEPVVFLADHPTTGGYPVIGVVDEEDLWQCAQARPGDRLRFTRA